MDECRRLARECENRRDWLEACWWYDELLRIDRTDRDGKEGYRRCLRRFHLARRHRDATYRDTLSHLTPAQALDLYDQVLQVLAAGYVDPSRVSADRLVANGIREVRLALEEPAFLQAHLPGVSEDVIKTFKDSLERWQQQGGLSRSQAREQVLRAARLGSQAGVPVSPPFLVVLGLEFASGACNALDEYTLFLTPGHFDTWDAELQGRTVGVGVDLAVADRKVVIARVYPKSPAEEMGLLPQDRIVRIDSQPVDEMSPELIAQKLRGDPGTSVVLDVATAGQMDPMPVKLVRRLVISPSVEHRVLTDMMMGAEPLGLLRISCFQESTLQEVKEAIAQLQTAGVRGLILDLRGNPGGLFHSAVQVAELFLGEGIIAYTESPLRQYSRPFRVESMNPLLLPVVILVDRETASAAEVLAGALKEHGRAHLLGQTTFGKDSIQKTVLLKRLPLARTPGGVRLTVARIFSPSRHTYQRGIVPHDFVEPEGEAILTAARIYLQSVADMMLR